MFYQTKVLNNGLLSYLLMEAQQINSEKYGSKYPDSTNIIEALGASSRPYLEIEVADFEVFKSEKGYDGVSFTDKKGKRYHTLGSRVVGFAKSDKVGLRDLINQASDKAVTVFFTQEVPDQKYSKRDTILSAGLIRPRG